MNGDTPIELPMNVVLYLVVLTMRYDKRASY